MSDEFPKLRRDVLEKHVRVETYDSADGSVTVFVPRNEVDFAILAAEVGRDGWFTRVVGEALKLGRFPTREELEQAAARALVGGEILTKQARWEKAREGAMA